MQALLAVDKPATGGGMYLSVVGRQVGSGDYRARLRLYPSGAVVLQTMRGGTTLDAVVVSGLTYVPGEQLASSVWDAYTGLTAVTGRLQLFVTTSYGSPGPLLHPLACSGVEALHLDLVKGAAPTAEELELFRGEDSAVLVAGAVDGHNVWRADLAGRLEILILALPFTRLFWRG